MKKKISILINKHNFILGLFMFYVFLGVYFYDSISLFSIIDELFTLTLLFLSILFCKRKVSIQITCFLLLSLFYLILSLNMKNNTPIAIISDFIIFSKSFIVFFLIRNTKLSFIENSKTILFIVFLLAVLTIIICLFGNSTIELIFGHPSRLATISVFLSLLYLLYSKEPNFVIYFLLLSIGLFSFRSKFFGYYVVSICLYWYYMIRKIKLSKLIVSILFVIVIILMLLAVKSKIFFYFVKGTENSEDMFARPALYLNSLKIAKDYFPLGSGYGSFGSFSSGLYYSNIYSEYGLDRIYGLTEAKPTFIADTYFPMLLAQFGVFGFMLYFIFFIRIIKFSSTLNTYLNNNKVFLIIILIIFFIQIESIADATLAQNRGVFIMFLLALALNKMEVDNEYLTIK